nr:SGNH/GDSL hydrolase family protein [Clostridia bacterium]
MILTKKQLDKIVHGTVQSKEYDGLYAYYRFDDALLEYYSKTNSTFYKRALHTASIRMEFDTDAEQLAFDYKTQNTVTVGCLDVCVNNVPYLVHHFENAPEGRFVCTLPVGMKRVTVWFPPYNQLLIGNVDISGSIKAVHHRTKVLWIGDSITQGATVQVEGHMLACGSYVNLVTAANGWDSINQAIGGQTYDRAMVNRHEGYTPDKIVISLGTNYAASANFLERAKEFYAALDEKYHGIKTLVISPIWRGKTNPDLDIHEVIFKNNTGIAKMCEKYQNITIVDGFKLVPNIPEIYRDDLLHPLTLGHRYYADNLIRVMKKLKF